jgi:hypothetical protein
LLPPETAENGVAMNIELRYALSPNKHSPGARIPFSNCLNRDIPSNAKQSDVDPE